MQVTCESCGKTYTVSDERVRGRAFKYKCKVCDEYNTVPASGHGPWDLEEQDDPDRALGTPMPVSIIPSAPPPPPSADAVGDDDYGAVEAPTPAAPAEAAADDGAMSVSGDAVAMEDEASADQPARPALIVVPPLAEDREPEPAEGHEAEPAAERPSLMDAAGGDDALAGEEPPARTAATAEIMAAAIAAAPPTPPPVAYSPEAEEAAGEESSEKPSWTGARSEDSVLFSMNQLKTVASSRPSSDGRAAKEPRPAMPPPAAPPPPEEPQRAPDSEDSNSRLYDIRAIAAASVDAHPTLVDRGVEELFNIEVGGFRDPAADSPVALRDPKAQPGGLVYAVFALAAVMLLANLVLGGTLYLHITSDRDRPIEVVVRPDDLRGLQGGDVAASLAPPGPDAAAAPSDGGATPAAQADASTPAHDASAAWSTDEWSEEHRTADERTAQRDAAPERAPEHESTSEPPETEQASLTPAATQERPERRPEPRPEPRTRPEPENDSPLANDVTEAIGETPAPPPPPSGLPDTLSTTQVVSVMNGIAGRVRRCGDGTPGTVTVNVTIAGSGRVTASTVTGDFAGTPVGSCAARTVRSAVFPQFGQPSMSVRYPFPL